MLHFFTTVNYQSNLYLIYPACKLVDTSIIQLHLLKQLKLKITIDCRKKMAALLENQLIFFVIK